MRQTVLPDAKNEEKHAVNRQVYDGHKETDSRKGARAQRKKDAQIFAPLRLRVIYPEPIRYVLNTEH